MGVEKKAYDQEQFRKYLKRLHSKIHWLLIYKEQHPEVLASYFDLLQKQIRGLGVLLGNPSEILELQVLVECARDEYNRGENCNNASYRQSVLDAHTVIDHIPNKGVDNCE